MKSAVKSRLLAAAAAAMLIPAAAHAQAPATGFGPEGDYPVTIGDPYVVGGVTYSPSDTLNYDAVGYAHAGIAGSGISGAHHTLPLPCYVEVTSLDSGHTILVRLDRRGPMTGKQLVELSPDAWAQLGLPAGADAPVRVRRVNPPEPERAALRRGNRAPGRMDTPPGLLSALRRKLGIATATTPDEPPSATLGGSPAPHAAAVSAPIRPAAAPPQQPVAPVAAAKPQPKPEPVVAHPAPPAKPKAPEPKPPTPKPATPKPEAPKPAPKPAEPKPEAKAGKSWAIQVAAFGERAHAEKAAAQVGGKVEPAGKLWRVRIPVEGEDQARAALAKAKHAGYAGAMILHHD
jgi:rare lipoprotein A